MSKPNALIYDVEILRCIPDVYEDDDPDLEYCGGWDDFTGMGISCVAAFDCLTGLYHLFLEDNLSDFQGLVLERASIVGFNSSSFDDRLCRANGLEIKTTYDLLCEVRVASGQPPYYQRGVTRAGYSLGALARANLAFGKEGHGAEAPEAWQRGRRGSVVNYALRDIQITERLFRHRKGLIDPTNGEPLVCRDPEDG